MKNKKHLYKNRNNKEIKSSLRESYTQAYKKFGQNFLVDTKYSNFMVDNLNIKKGDFIIEIGPGMGALTQLIMAKKEELDLKYLAIEIDIEKIIYLKTEYSNIDIHNGSILDFDIDTYCEENNISNYKIIGSLPFNISKKIFQKFSECRKRPELAVFMVQKEVGQDYFPQDGNTTFLSVYLSQFWEVLDHQIVPANAFFPIPKVDGLTLVLKPTFSPDYKLIKYVKSGFSSPRKKLGNVLPLSKENLYFNKRPHELSLEDWRNLFDLEHNIG